VAGVMLLTTITCCPLISNFLPSPRLKRAEGHTISGAGHSTPLFWSSWNTADKDIPNHVPYTEWKTNDRQYNSHRKKKNDRQYNSHRVFLSVAIILSVICFSFCGYYIVCHLFFFLWILYCLSFVFLSVAIILSVICFCFCGYYIVCHL
jgi:hypothetical protein